MTEIQKSLNHYITAEMDYWDFSGVVRIIQRGGILFETSRRYSNIEFHIKNTTEPRFTVAFVAKQFTAFAIMILYDQGLIRLDEKANRYLPPNMPMGFICRKTKITIVTSWSDMRNRESLDPYRFGNGIAAIMHHKQASLSRRPEEILLSPKDLEKYIGTYPPSQIYIEQKNGKFYLIRVNQNIHIELYCMGKDRFKRRCEEQQTVHKFISEGDEKPSVWGYELICKQFV